MLAPVDSKLCPNLLLDGDLIGVGQWAAQHHVDQDLCERIRQEKRRFTQQPVVSAPLPSSIVSLLYLARFAKVPPYSHRIQYHRTIVYTNKWPQTNGPSQKNSGYSRLPPRKLAAIRADRDRHGSGQRTLVFRRLAHGIGVLHHILPVCQAPRRPAPIKSPDRADWSWQIFL